MGMSVSVAYILEMSLLSQIWRARQILDPIAKSFSEEIAPDYSSATKYDSACFLPCSPAQCTNKRLDFCESNRYKIVLNMSPKF